MEANKRWERFVYAKCENVNIVFVLFNAASATIPNTHQASDMLTLYDKGNRL